MGRIIKRFSDGSFLEYDWGNFDGWCVYHTDPNGIRKAPRDMDCFLELQSLSRRYGAGRMYEDFVQIYDMTEKEINRDVLDNICWLAGSYGKISLRVDTVFSILYMAMVAEERKAGTRLGKRIKRLGVHTCRRAERASLEKELRGRMMPEMELYFYRVWIEGKRIVVLAIPAADQEPSAYDGKAYVQVNGERRDIDASPELKSRLMDTLVSGIPSMGDWKSYSQRLALWKMRLRLAEKGIELDKEIVKRGYLFYKPH